MQAAGTFIFLSGTLVWLASWATFNNTIKFFNEKNRQFAAGWFYAWLMIVGVSTFAFSASVWAQG